MEAVGDALGIEVRVRQMSAHVGQCLATANEAFARVGASRSNYLLAKTFDCDGAVGAVAAFFKGLEQEVKVVLLIVGLGDVAAGAPDLLGPGPFGGQAEVGVLAQSDLSAESGTDGIGPN